MYNNLLSFKKFINEDMDASMDKNLDVSKGKDNKSSSDDDKMDYFSGLGEEQGIEWADLAQALELQPWVSDHFKMGGMQHKLSPWQIVPGSLTPNGASIRLKPQIGDRTYLKGNRLNKSNYVDKNQYYLNRQQLIAFLTTGWSPALNSAAQGGMPGADPMAGGMPSGAPM